ncbi:Mannosyl-oligosaccharide glucosidase protein [Dioscorea alata]|uniref:Mannosyl-oligosaccharide glucosidase protein n=1 Tax=Dioscorea alata TaxID=55571 RepID=A0ACB7V9N1_DIOAL|nr:Mannosyl-oligosaccharide glucosidase protein [Dioscorea alata]
MSGAGSRRTARSRGRPAGVDSDRDEAVRNQKPIRVIGKDRSRDHGPIRLMNVSVTKLLVLGVGFLALLFLALLFYTYSLASEEDEVARMARTSVTPLDAPKMMDLPQFQGEHRESLYWGTYRPQVYLGIRARTPQSLIAGLMWIGIKNGQYFLRHVCDDSDGLNTFGWIDHNGRDYGHQVLVDHDISLTTSFLKDRQNGSGYGGDWAVRVDVKKNDSDEAKQNLVHLFFYMADEEGNSISTGKDIDNFDGATLLTFGSRKDVGRWELHLESKDDVEIHYSGFKTPHMHNLTELVQGALAFHARTTGRLLLPDVYDDSSNVVVFQITAKLPSKLDIAFISGTGLRSSRVEERINQLRGTKLTSRLDEKQKDFEERFHNIFNLKDKVDSETIAVGRAAIGNLLGGIGYFYGQSKIALPKGFSLKNGDKFISYWPAALYTAVPSRSYFPRGFLWDEGFHQLLVGRWDISICMDIIGHWLDLINVNGWIPREQILGAEALSKVPEEFVAQHPSNGNPPMLFLALRDLANGLKENKFSAKEANEVSAFLDRAYIRLGKWFQWFNTTQSGKALNTFYWHGRDNTTNKELNPKTLSSGLDDYPRASHPSDDERHLDLRCWMFLAANCMHSIAELFGTNSGLEKEYENMAKELADFETLNQMHLDDNSGAYFDFGNHTEKASSILGKQMDIISNRTILWTDYGLRSLSRTSSMYMKRNTEHDPPYWRGPIWINMNFMILSALHHYSQENGPYKVRAKAIYDELRSNLIRNVVRNYYETGFLWEHYDQANKGKGKGTRPFTGWTSLVLLIMSETYPSL